MYLKLRLALALELVYKIAVLSTSILQKLGIGYIPASCPGG